MAGEGWMRRGHMEIPATMTLNLLRAVMCCYQQWILLWGGRRNRRRRRRQSGFTEEEILSSIQGRLRETGGGLGELC